MGVSDRVILALFTVLIAAASVASLWQVVTGVPLIPGPAQEFILTLEGRLLTGAVAVILLCLCVRVLYASYTRGGRPTVLLREGELGQTHVSLLAVEHLVHRVVSHIPGVRDVRPRVTAKNNDLLITIRVTVGPDCAVPLLTDKVQHTIDDQVREIIGIGVSSIRVVVDDLMDDARRGRLDAGGQRD